MSALSAADHYAAQAKTQNDYAAEQLARVARGEPAYTAPIPFQIFQSTGVPTAVTSTTDVKNGKSKVSVKFILSNSIEEYNKNIVVGGQHGKGPMDSLPFGFFIKFSITKKQQADAVLMAQLQAMVTAHTPVVVTAGATKYKTETSEGWYASFISAVPVGGSTA